MQKNIDDFFKRTKDSTKREYDIKKYFYLLWENKFHPNSNAYWTDKKPDKINFIQTENQNINCNYATLCQKYIEIVNKRKCLIKNNKVSLIIAPNTAHLYDNDIK